MILFPEHYDKTWEGYIPKSNWHGQNFNPLSTPSKVYVGFPIASMAHASAAEMGYGYLEFESQFIAATWGDGCFSHFGCTCRCVFGSRASGVRCWHRLQMFGMFAILTLGIRILQECLCSQNHIHRYEKIVILNLGMLIIDLAWNHIASNSM